MLKNITKFNVIKIKKVHLNRTFLSEAYKCTEAWNARLKTPILQKVQIDSIYYELDQKFQHKRKVSAIDIDVFANRLDNDGYSDELADLINRFRLTDQINDTLESTGHAVIRHYFEYDQIQQLVSILNDRINYGVFLDKFTVNIALDKLIKNKDFKSAAKFASIFMLEEDFSHPLTKYLCLYSCYQYIKTTDLLREKIEIPIPIKKEKKEEIKVRVKYLRNEFFDDHFDLSDLNHLTGKTLIMIGDTESSNETLQNSLRLIGYCLYEKYGKAIEILDNVKNENYYKDIIVMITKILEEYKDREADDNYNKLMETIKILQSSTNLKTDNFEEFICKFTYETVAKYEPIDIENQKKVCIIII